MLGPFVPIDSSLWVIVTRICDMPAFEKYKAKDTTRTLVHCGIFSGREIPSDKTLKDTLIIRLPRHRSPVLLSEGGDCHKAVPTTAEQKEITNGHIKAGWRRPAWPRECHARS